jgi:hypothetical protein
VVAVAELLAQDLHNIFDECCFNPPVICFHFLSKEENMLRLKFAVGALCATLFTLSALPVDAQGPIRNRLRERVQARLNSPQLTPYYERDRWVDVSEWFDGNNFNPTNEITDRLSDLQQRQARLNGGSRFDYGTYDDWYGFQADTKANADLNWFYDYYDHGYYYTPSAADGSTSDGSRYSYRYYDMDNDGFYDAYTTYRDDDRDGKFDDEQWYSFNVDQQANVEKSSTSVETETNRPETLTTRQSVSGTVTRSKQTRTPDAMHTVISVKSDSQADEMFVDVGATTDSNSHSIHVGDKVTAEGPVVDIGDKQLMLADKVRVNDEELNINRPQRSWEGVIVDSRDIDLRNESNLMAIVYTSNNERVLVDLGAKDNFKFDLQPNDEIVVSGVPMKIKGRQVVMAHDVQLGEQKIQIVRGNNRVRVNK